MLPVTLEGFTRHAEIHGTECIYETAVSYLDESDLFELSKRLVAMDKNWLGQEKARSRFLVDCGLGTGEGSRVPKTGAFQAENRKKDVPGALDPLFADKLRTAAGCRKCDIALQPFQTLDKAIAWAYKHSKSKRHVEANAAAVA